MNKNIENIITEQEVEGAVCHSGLRKGAVVIAVTGIIGVAGYLTHRFVIKPIVKKIKAKKELKKVETNRQISLFPDDNVDEIIEPIFPEEE